MQNVPLSIESKSHVVWMPGWRAVLSRTFHDCLNAVALWRHLDNSHPDIISFPQS